MHASENGVLECLKLFISHGANVNQETSENSLTSLNFAVNCENRIECVQYLLDCGVSCTNVDIKTVTDPKVRNLIATASADSNLYVYK
jgi:ankyrin repeat protein